VTHTLLGPQIVQMLDARADQVVPHLTNESSWPTLRAYLLTLAAETGEHPLLHLHTAAAGRDPAPAPPTPHRSRHGSSLGLAPPRADSPTQGRFLGFPGFRKRFMIIPVGTNIWRSGPA
jgi:hypothetical protein